MQAAPVPLPTLAKLGVDPGVLLGAKAEAPSIASAWFESFATHLLAADIPAVVALFVHVQDIDPFWRDILALTWNFRTIQGVEKIRALLADRLHNAKLGGLKMKPDSVTLATPLEGVAWIQFLFDFETDIGFGQGVVRLVPTLVDSQGGTSSGSPTWRAHTVLTSLAELKGHPEQIGLLRSSTPSYDWAERRQREVDCADSDPKVIVIGGGQAGLAIAARLKFLGMPTLIIEKEARVGDQWRSRYDALCLHDVVWRDHMPYIPFPVTWPVYPPGRKVADWLESYATTLDLNVWTSSTVVGMGLDHASGKWTISIDRGEPRERRTFVVNHVVLATGMNGTPKMPSYSGMDDFKGRLIHSSDHRRAKENIGKKVAVIGSCTSAHDICADHARHGIDVTMLQRKSTYVMSAERLAMTQPLYREMGPPLDEADLITSSFPLTMLRAMNRIYATETARFDRHLLDQLSSKGFLLNDGGDGTGFFTLAFTRSGGYYIDTGASGMIIDDSIKLKSDAQIERFTPTGLEFKDGSHLDADVVICATGYGDMRETFRKMCGDEITDSVQQLWGLDDEGEINGLWKDSGVRGLWVMMGNLSLCRMHSKHLALQIKAAEEGISQERYTCGEGRL